MALGEDAVVKDTAAIAVVMEGKVVVAVEVTMVVVVETATKYLLLLFTCDCDPCLNQPPRITRKQQQSHAHKMVLAFNIIFVLEI